MKLMGDNMTVIRLTWLSSLLKKEEQSSEAGHRQAGLDYMKQGWRDIAWTLLPDWAKMRGSVFPVAENLYFLLEKVWISHGESLYFLFQWVCISCYRRSVLPVGESLYFPLEKVYISCWRGSVFHVAESLCFLLETRIIHSDMSPLRFHNACSWTILWPQEALVQGHVCIQAVFSAWDTFALSAIKFLHFLPSPTQIFLPMYNLPQIHRVDLTSPAQDAPRCLVQTSAITSAALHFRSTAPHWGISTPAFSALLRMPQRQELRLPHSPITRM